MYLWMNQIIKSSYVFLSYFELPTVNYPKRYFILSVNLHQSHIPQMIAKDSALNLNTSLKQTGYESLSLSKCFKTALFCCVKSLAAAKYITDR